ncbi:MAG: aminodeoxychorismate synthase component I [bacterium]
MKSPFTQPIPFREGPESYRRLCHEAEEPFCLYSGGGGRYSYLGFNPLLKVDFYPDGIRWGGGEKKQTICENPFDWMEKKFVHSVLPSIQDFFGSGWVGFLAYEMASFADGVLPRRELPPDFLLGSFGLYDPLLVFDHEKKEAWASSWGLAEDFSSHEGLAKERVFELSSRCRSFPDSFPLEPSAVIPPWEKFRSNFTREKYESAVRRILDYLAEGDCYQVNLSQQFSADFSPSPDLFSLFWERAKAHPAPFSAFLDAGALQILSLSPEEFLKIQGNKIETRPIKGTRKRSLNAEEDLRILTELESAPKDQAELLMIVDLERNDLGKICKAGSVKVPRLKEVESFDYVHHLVATVVGELREGVTPFGALKALFPGGSITGAPKRRAMQIIQEIEPTPRGVYTGVIGYVDYSSMAQMNIAIRTLVYENGNFQFGVGGGIVAESDPKAEYEETLTKAKVFSG